MAHVFNDKLKTNQYYVEATMDKVLIDKKKKTAQTKLRTDAILDDIANLKLIRCVQLNKLELAKAKFSIIGFTWSLRICTSMIIQMTLSHKD